MHRRYKTLADYFEQTGETQAAFAERVGVSRPCVSQWVSRVREPLPLWRTKQVMELTGVPLEGLFRDGLEA